MGCDIHMHVEFKRDGSKKWYCGDYFHLACESTLDHPKYILAELYRDRSYALFGILADVRNRDGLEYISLPKGFPEDATDVTKEDYEDWNMDAHSCSYLTLKEMIDFREVHDSDDYYMLEVLIDKMKQRADELNLIYNFEWDSLYGHAEAYRKSKYIRIVFWFDN